MDKAKLLDVFYEECEENIQALETGAMAMEARPDDPALCGTIFRAVHSIKGGAASFGFSAMGSFSHALEDMLDGLRKGRTAVTKERIGIILDSADCLKKLLAAGRTREAVDPALAQGLVRRIETSNGGACATQKAENAGALQAPFDNGFSVVYRPNPLCLSRGEDPLRALERLSKQMKVLSLTARCDNLPPLDRFSPDNCYFWWELEGTSPFPEELTLRNLASVVEGSVEVRSRSSLMSAALAEQSSPRMLTDRPPSLLGSILIEGGLVSEEQLSQALAKQTPCMPLGEVLIDEGVITAPQLGAALGKQKAALRRDDASVRINSSKLDRLMDLSGELAIVSTHLAQISAEPGLSDMPGLRETLENLERNSRDLQDTAMSIRMLPLGNIFNRFPRLVRDMAVASGKKVALVISGDSTELDKGLIEKLAEVLTHLIRNAVDHGVEPPEARAAGGKSESATIKVKAFEDAGSVVITVEDDGRGLDRKAILKKAVSAGLVDESTVSGMSDQDVHALIFHAGFSTAEAVTEVSGRGVGLDVVKTGMEAMGGTVGVSTRPGVFTRFVLRLPMTLAIMDGQLVRVGDERFVIPLVSVVETMQPQASEVKLIEGQGEVLFWRGECLPFFRLYEVLGGEAWEPAVEGALVIIVEHEGRRKALMVDDLLEQQQVVIKGLGSILPPLQGIAGAAILGDGKVVLILDIGTLDGLASRRER